MRHDDLRSRLVADLARLRAAHDVPGVSVAVDTGNETVDVVDGVINTRTGVHVTVDTVFQIQSVTKICTATLVMQLVDEGLLELDDPVQAHLPEFHTADPEASARVSVRNLLTHTGGFEGDLWQPTTSGHDALDRFVRTIVTGARQYSPPGTRFSYCSAGFGVLGRIVEVTRGLPFEAALRRHLLEPLHIDEVAFSADQALAFRAAIGHVRHTPSTALRPTTHWALMPPSNPAAGNQLAMSARGLARLGRVYTGTAASTPQPGVLSPEAVEQMLTPQLTQREAVPSPVEQGLGWRLPHRRVCEHSGGAPGTVAYLAVVPDRDLTVAVLVNADAGTRLVTDLVTPLLADLAGISPRAARTVPSGDTRRVPTASLVGRYCNRQAELVVDCGDDGRIWLTTHPRHESLQLAACAGTRPEPTRHELRPLADDVFVRITASDEPAGTLSFLAPDSRGRYTLVADDRVAARTDHAPLE